MLLFLRAHNRKAALIEMHENPCLSSYAQVYSDAVLEKDSCIINGSRLYFSKKALPTIQKEFDFLVLDYGAYRNCAVQELAASDAAVIVCGIKPWEAEEINYTFRENNEKYHYLFSFVPKNDEENVTAQMEEFSQRTFFAPYSPDMFNTMETMSYIKRCFGIAYKRRCDIMSHLFYKVERRNLICFSYCRQF